MRTVIHKWIGLAVIAALVFASAWAAAQGYGQGQQQPSKPPAPGQPQQPSEAKPETPAAPPVDPEEEAAWKAFMDSKTAEPPKQMQLGEEFLKKYPTSRYASFAYARLARLYLSMGQEDKMIVAGEKALELNPNNVDVMAQLGMVMSRRAGTGLDADQRLTKSERYSRRAIALLEPMQKSASSTMTDEDFTKAKNEELSMAHSGLGFVNYQRQRFADAATEFEQATKLAANPDPVDFFVLGLSYEQTKRFSDAVTAYERCAAVPGAMQPRCKSAAEQAKKVAATQLSAPKP